MQANDSKLLWNSINWKGKVDIKEVEGPNDDQFKEHVEKLLNLENIADIGDVDIENGVPYIPVLDDPVLCR